MITYVRSAYENCHGVPGKTLRISLENFLGFNKERDNVSMAIIDTFYNSKYPLNT
jgi:hypothetical protein